MYMNAYQAGVLRHYGNNVDVCCVLKGFGGGVVEGYLLGLICM